MAKITIPNITGGFASVTAVNTHLQAIEDELNNKVLYRDNPEGEPNSMQSDLDMNGNSILNVSSFILDGIDIAQVAADAASSADAAASSASLAAGYAEDVEGVADEVVNWTFEGAWTSLDSYKKNNIVTYDGETYICLVDHIAGTFSTDYASLKWAKLASKGAAGAGTGDLVSTNNLSDVANTATALANLGGQPVDAELTAIAGLTSAADKAPYFTGAGTASLMTVTLAGRNLLDDADAAAQRTTLGAQATLVSGTSIKTVNSTSLLGSGNISVQPTLVSGTNIKTINGSSLLGSGDLSIGGMSILSTQEPTSDVSEITQTGLGSYSKVRAVFMVSDAASSTSNALEIGVRTSAGSWRTIYSSPVTNRSYIGDVTIHKLDTDVLVVSGSIGTITTVLDRTSATLTCTSFSPVAGASTHAETFDEMRVKINGTNIEGSTADARAFVVFYGEV